MLTDLLGDRKLDALLVSTLTNVRFYSGFTGSNGLLLVSASGGILFTDPRYTTQARAESRFPVETIKGPLLAAIAKRLARLRVHRLGIEDQRISHTLYSSLAKLARLVPLGMDIESPRWIKSDAEIAAIRASVALNSAALDAALAHFRPGITETELAAEIDYQMRLRGASGPAFDTIVASGPHSARPHARPRPEPVRPGGYLLIDMGACLNGYMSDMTRTFGVGRMPRRARQIHDAVLESQLAALAAVRPGRRCGQVHAAAVAALRKHELHKYFIHSTGHGLGLEIHEPPRLAKADKAILAPGMVITIEPGVYIEDFGGVRIEDTVLVTANGMERLTQTPKAWTILDENPS
ncbi:MAG: M24 family metallopeptidase [Acidobacteriota bacterium]